MYSQIVPINMQDVHKMEKDSDYIFVVYWYFQNSLVYTTVARGRSVKIYRGTRPQNSNCLFLTFAENCPLF